MFGQQMILSENMVVIDLPSLYVTDHTSQGLSYSKIKVHRFWGWKKYVYIIRSLGVCKKNIS